MLSLGASPQACGTGAAGCAGRELSAGSWRRCALMAEVLQYCGHPGTEALLPRLRMRPEDPREGPCGVSCQTTSSWTLPGRRSAPPAVGFPPVCHVLKLTCHPPFLSTMGSLFCCFVRFSSLLVELYLFLSCTTNGPGDSVEAFC